MTVAGTPIEEFKKRICQIGILNKTEVRYFVDLYVKNIEGFDVIKDLVKYVHAIRLQNRIDLIAIHIKNNKNTASFIDDLYTEFIFQAIAVQWYKKQGLKPMLQARIDEYKRNNGYGK